jgi:pyruvate/2-oxoglutarate dehydrogenase complex dihydrolipoamide acyltransferase (E2) component
VKRKPGRPPGSKNKKPAESAKATPAKAAPAKAAPAKAAPAKAAKPAAASAPKAAAPATNDAVEFRRLVIKLGVARATELLALVRRQIDNLIAGH